MAFLDNSGDIILDAVLTDTGRMRLAKGDGTFKIVKFALGDDEINYGLFNKNHPSGSAYYDLDIMQTPVLEAFTNNTSILKHKLLSMPQTNLLYLPVVKLNAFTPGYESCVIPANWDTDVSTLSSTAGETNPNITGIYFLPADEETKDELTELKLTTGVLQSSGTKIRTHQGLDIDEISRDRSIGDLKETQYILQADNRLCFVTEATDTTKTADVSYIDDDQIASYYFSRQNDEYTDELKDSDPKDVIKGPQGTYIHFNLVATPEIESSTALFAELGGGDGSIMVIKNGNSGNKEFLYIDTNVRVTGATTGSSIDIPVRVLKKK